MSDGKNINESVHFERKDINARVLAWIGAGIVAAAILLQLFLYLFYQGIKNSAAPSEGLPASLVREQEHAPPFEPQLQANPVEDFKELRARENEKLNSYGWIDKEKGIVRIPIEQAMSVIVQRGLQSAKTEPIGDKQTPNNAPQSKK